MTAHAAAVHSMPSLAPAGPAGSAAASAAVIAPVPSHSGGVSRGRRCSVPVSRPAERGSHTPAQSSCRFRQHILSALQAAGLNLHFASHAGQSGSAVLQDVSCKPNLKQAIDDKQSESRRFCAVK